MKEFLKSIKAAIDDPDLSAEIIKEMQRRDEVQQESSAKVDHLKKEIEGLRQEYSNFKAKYDDLLEAAELDAGFAASQRQEANELREKMLQEQASVAFAKGQGEAAYNMARLVFGNKVLLENNHKEYRDEYDQSTGNSSKVLAREINTQTIETQTDP